MAENEQDWGVFAHNKEEKEFGLALAPSCQREVQKVLFNTFTGGVSVVFADDGIPLPFGFLPDTVDATAVSAYKIHVAHFATMKDFLEINTSREYFVPFFAD